MKTVMKKLLSVMLVALLLVSAVPFQASADEAATYSITIKLRLDGKEMDGSVVLSGLADQYELSANDIKAHAEMNTEWNYYMYNQAKYNFVSSQAAKIDGADVTVYVDVATKSAPPATEPEETEPEETEPEETEPEETKPSYGTLTIYVRLYNSNNEVREYPVTFSGEATYTLNKDLANKALAKAGVVNVEEYRWQRNAGETLTMDKDQEAYLIADPIMTPGNKKIITITLMNNDGTSDRQFVEALAGDEILEAIAADKSYKEPTRKGYTFAGWSFDMNCADDIGRDDVANSDITIFAEWERIPENNKYSVTLRVYTNGDGINVDRTFDMSGYGDVITRDEVKSVISKHYTAKSGYTLSYQGLFTNKTWDDGDYDLDDAVSSIEVDDIGNTVIYVMVNNVKVVAADPTNPKTGDGIVIALATMMSTGGAALALGKKKFF